ncbi:MAG: hypothetical protein LBH62_06975 [Nitrososphaerota archaeon]|jgi:hypothetical protein|nr:hypothetical protein [Nitrososphaerota archaeon]
MSEDSNTTPTNKTPITDKSGTVKKDEWDEYVTRWIREVTQLCKPKNYTQLRIRQIKPLICVIIALSILTVLSIIKAYTNSSLESILNGIAVIVALIATSTSLIFTLSAREDLADDYFKTIKEKKELQPEEKMCLKALINMKCRVFLRSRRCTQDKPRVVH